jgi:hypothetical protein
MLSCSLSAAIENFVLPLQAAKAALKASQSLFIPLMSVTACYQKDDSLFSDPYHNSCTLCVLPSHVKVCQGTRESKRLLHCIVDRLHEDQIVCGGRIQMDG